MTRRRPSIQLISLSEQSDLNPHLRSIRVVRGKIETPCTQAEIGSHLSSDGEADGKVDTIVSEPIGVLLFHERMVSLVLVPRATHLSYRAGLMSSDWIDFGRTGGIFLYGS
jgi:histone-arginine methyltransferase CARM1